MKFLLKSELRTWAAAMKAFLLSGIQMKKLFVILLVILTLDSCRKDSPITHRNTIMPDIVGNWKLIEARGGFGGGLLSWGFGNITFKLNGIYNSDILNFETEGIYEMYHISTPPGYHRSEFQIRFDSRPIKYFLLMKNDSINLFFDGNDGVDFVFVRQ